MRWEYLSGILKVISKLCFVKDKMETFEEKIISDDPTGTVANVNSSSKRTNSSTTQAAQNLNP